MLSPHDPNRPSVGKTIYAWVHVLTQFNLSSEDKRVEGDGDGHRLEILGRKARHKYITAFADHVKRNE